MTEFSSNAFTSNTGWQILYDFEQKLALQTKSMQLINIFNLRQNANRIDKINLLPRNICQLIADNYCEFW